MTALVIPIISFAIVYYLVSLYSAHMFARRKPHARGSTPPVSVLKPVKGLDFEAFDNFASFLHQDYASYQVLFGVESKDDPVVPVIRRLIQTFPEHDIQLMITGPVKAMNRKVGLLSALAAEARHQLLVISDSDVRVPPNYLKDVVAPFLDPETGIVTCLYKTTGHQSIAARLESLMINVDLFPAVLVAERLEGVRFGLGATMAVRHSALGAIGGFDSLADFLADDYLLGRRVHDAGYRVVLSPLVVNLVLGAPGMKDFLMHQLRWARTYKICRRRGYFASVLTQGVFFSFVYLLASGFSPLGWFLFAITAAVRVLTAALLLARYIKDDSWFSGLLLLPVKEMISLAIWALAFLGNRIAWKDKSFALDKDGRMIQL
jgi:ceramide glucosyltransferase